jgi:serine/threonine-protein kinase
VPPGYLLFDRGRFLMAARFDPEKLELVGDPVPVLEVPGTQFGAFSIRGGTLTYLAGLVSWHNVAALVDRRGVRRPLENLPPSQDYGFPSVSPDGRKIALRVTPPGGGPWDMDLWVYQLPRGPLTRLTSEAGQDDDPSWTPDGKRILFDSDRGGDNALWWKPWDGSGEAEKILDRPLGIWRTSWLPDGRRFLFWETQSNGLANIGLATVGQPDSTRMLLTSAHDESYPAASPDGRWMAYQSDESGRPEIYIRPLEGAASRRQVSRDGGISPVWARSGRELFFQSAAGDSLYAARLDTDHDGALLGLDALFALRQGNSGFDVLPGDSLFVLPEPTGPGAERGLPVVVVHNFVAELEARLGRPTK